MSHPLYCFICTERLDNGSQTRTVKQKGINALIAKSKIKKDNKWRCLENLTEVTVHEQCRVNYSVSNKKTTDVIEEAGAALPPEPPFSFVAHCFLCSKAWIPKDKPGREVCTSKAQDRINECIKLRNDDWSETVQGRIEGKNLLQEKARYHNSCWDQFRYPRKPSTEPKARYPDLEAAFEKVCRYMEESDDCQFTFKELLDKMEGWTTTVITLKQKLINKYGTEILMVEKPGQPTIICFRNTGYKILENFWNEERPHRHEEERIRIVRAAAAIIREDIRTKVYATSSYSAPEDLLKNVKEDIPETLSIFLDDLLLKGKKSNGTKLMMKRNSLAHSVISIIRPKSFISSIHLATGVYLTRKFGSRLIIDVLDKLGYCTSYTSISLYEASAIMSCDKKIENDAYIQHVYGNADHNVCTVDDFNTFHSMGGICCVTPRKRVTTQGKIKKLTRVPKAKELASTYNIPIVSCDQLCNTKTGLKSITFSDVSQLIIGDRDKLPAAYNLHIWAKYLQIPSVPSWRGFMEALSHDSEYQVGQVFCLPFVNLLPSNMDTINTVLNHAHVKSLKINQKTCFVTVDQPLYVKARELVANKEAFLEGVVVRLGGFHMLMSFLGAVGTIMNGSGLKELLVTVYASNTVDHMLAGSAFSRAIRGHLLVYTALGTIIAKNAGNIEDEERTYMQNLLNEFELQPPTLEEVNSDEQLQKISDKVLEMMETLSSVGRTSRLWLQYFHCITLMMQFIEAEQLGNWELHLQCVRDMLPIFHAASHLAYAKSAQIYLQDMSHLPSIMDPREYDLFTREGYFTIRRSDKKWGGVWTDMTVEQTLMRMMKISGGLTHGREATEEGVQARWILGMPIAFEVIDAFETFCGVRAESTEQHTDWRPTNIKRDTEDFMKLVEWFTIHDPFATGDSDQIMSIADGICGGDQVNCDRALEIGKESMTSMIGVNAADVKLKRST